MATRISPATESSSTTSAGTTLPRRTSAATTPTDHPAELNSEALLERTQERRAVEVTIWGMPAVSMAAVRESLERDLGADFGDVIYFSNVMEPRHEFLTANNQTPYAFTCFDLRRGPVVLDVPPASEKTVFFGSAIDSWQVPLVDVGGSGADEGKGGRYLFLPPDYRGRRQNGYFLVPSSTHFVHVGLRPIPTGNGTLQDAVAYSQLLRTYPLTEASSPRQNRYIDAYPLTWRTLPRFDLSYFQLLAAVVDADPAQPRDAAMLGMLASIGIQKGQPFKPDRARARLLTRAVLEGAAYMNDTFRNRALDRFWPDRQWLGASAGDTHGFSYYGDGRLDYDRRAGGFAFWATWAPKRASDPGKPPASFYLKGFRDAAGEPFRGDRLYRLRVPANIPAQDFWSIVAYDTGTNAFIPNPENRVGVSSFDRGRLSANQDGSADVYVGPASPKGLSNNWIPTAGRDFWLVARFYGPKGELLDRSWVMPDVERVA